MQPRKSATATQPVATSSSQPACRTASLLVSLKSGSSKNTCPMVNSVAVRRMGREAARTMASSAEPYRKGFVPTRRTANGDFASMKVVKMSKLHRMWNFTILLIKAVLSTLQFGSPLRFLCRA